MEFSKLIEIQKDFDSILIDKLMKKIEHHGEIAGVSTKDVTKQMLEESNFLLVFKMLGLSVEVGELANATRCFKYWSSQEPENEDRILEELVDIYHLLFSVTNSLKFEPYQVEAAYVAKYIINMDRQNNGY